MKLKELPIYLDLLRLPWPVLRRRLVKRFLSSSKPVSSARVPQDLEINISNYGGLPDDLVEPDSYEALWRHYRRNEFDYLGSGWQSILNGSKSSGFLSFGFSDVPRQDLKSDEIDWNRDQRTGFQFPLNSSPSEALRLAFVTEGVDVKFCWEFTRFHHLPQMALLANNKPGLKLKISQILNSQLKTFRNQCPFGSGVNWSSPMEVAIRLVNILVGNDLFQKGCAEEKLFQAMTYEHWFFVANNLEYKEGLGTNHYLSNLMALVVTGCYIEEEQVRTKAQWAWVEFERELKKQFFEDGVNFEYSTYYHRLSAEIALVTIRFAQEQGFGISNSSWEIVNRALGFLGVLIKPDGMLPQFGDNDSGRILNLDPETEEQGGEIFPTPEKCGFIKDLKQPDSIYNWFYGSIINKLNFETRATQKEIKPKPWKPLHYENEWVIKYPEIELQEVSFHYFEKGGVVVYKSRNFYLAINLMCNPNGHRYRGHMHNDKGAFELQVHGKDFVLDPGTLSYTASAKIRNEYRSTSAHPVPFVGVEQNRYLEGNLGLFHAKLEVKAEVLELSAHRCVCRISYRGVEHIRRFEIRKDHLLVTDWCNRPFTINKNDKIKITRGYGKLL